MEFRTVAVDQFGRSLYRIVAKLQKKLLQLFVLSQWIFSNFETIYSGN